MCVPWKEQTLLQSLQTGLRRKAFHQSSQLEILEDPSIPFYGYIHSNHLIPSWRGSFGIVCLLLIPQNCARCWDPPILFPRGVLQDSRALGANYTSLSPSWRWCLRIVHLPAPHRAMLSVESYLPLSLRQYTEIPRQWVQAPLSCCPPEGAFSGLCAFSQPCRIKADAEILILSAGLCTCHIWGHKGHHLQGCWDAICAGAKGTGCGGMHNTDCRDTWGTNWRCACEIASCWGLHMGGLAGRFMGWLLWSMYQLPHGLFLAALRQSSYADFLSKPGGMRQKLTSQAMSQKVQDTSSSLCCLSPSGERNECRLSLSVLNCASLREVWCRLSETVQIIFSMAALGFCAPLGCLNFSTGP